MSRSTVFRPAKEQGTVDAVRAAIARREEAGTYPTCPVEMVSGFVGLCASQSCGKCTPCRVGLVQLKRLLDEVLDGEGTPQTIRRIKQLAEDIYLSADCAIGYDAAKTALDAVEGFKDDLAYHVEHKACGAAHFAAVPCVKTCPAHVDIPGYVALVGAGRSEDAVRLIRKDNPFPLACALICEHPCELACRRQQIDSPINIRALKRYAVDHCTNDYTPFHYEATGKKVAVIGGGPSGLTAAYYLALMGHEPTVFEQRDHLGGMMRYGIPAYRLPRERLDGEIDFILKQGIEVKLGVSVPSDVSLEELRDQFDAVYIAIGAHADKKLGLEGEGAEGVFSAVELLRGIGDGHHPDFSGKRVAVVGGGNVAMDCARSAVRLGADHTYIVYRRRVDDMTAQAEEIAGALEEGCELLELNAPVSIKTVDGKVAGIEVQRQMISVVDRGRPKPIKANVPPEVIDVDIVLVAIGQDIDSAPFEEAGLQVNRGKIRVDEFEAAAELPGVFVGGDCETGPLTVIRAIAAGKAAARNIDDYLGFDHKIKQDVEVPAVFATDKPACGRSKEGVRAACERAHDFESFEQCLSFEEAAQESWRCLRCDHFGYGAFREGRSEQW